MRYSKLGRTDALVSVIGFGASPLGDVFYPSDAKEGERAVHCAIEHGINFFDVSPFYGKTLAEKRLGSALTGRRHKVFLATKCGRYDVDRFDFSARRVQESIDHSLKRLNTDYVDLLQAHDIEFGDFQQIVNETVPALQAVQQSGKARFIGITGYPLKFLRKVAGKAHVDTILSYCRYNLLVTDLGANLATFTRERGIGLINASPLHMGILTDHGAPPWHPAPESVKQAGAEIARVCREQGYNPSVVALAFCLGHPDVASTLIGMLSETQVQENLKALDAQIDPGLFRRIQEIAAPVQNLVWPSGRPENSD